MILNNLENAEDKYQLIYADPPWKQKKSGFKKVRPNSSGKPLDYPVISLDEIKAHLKTASGGITTDIVSLDYRQIPV